MAFGKNKRRFAEFYSSENFEDSEHVLPDYEEYLNSDDDSVESLEILNSESRANVTNRINSTSKPLLDEVIIKGVPNVKNPGGAKVWECKHCRSTFTSTYTRIHAHFFGSSTGKKSEVKRCSALLSNRQEFEKIRKKVEEAEKGGVSHSLKNSKLTDKGLSKNKGTIAESFQYMDRHQVDKEIVTALCANGIPFNVLRNPHFCQMVRVINNAPKGYKAPSFEKARTSLLDDVKTTVEKNLIPVKDTWYTEGVSIVSDGWSNVKKEPLINILAVNSRGAVFLYAENCFGVEKTGARIAQLLLKAIEEVGPSNVIQVVTDNAANCKLAGEEVAKVHPHIFWSPCVVHTLNLIFKDLARSFKWFEETYSKGKKIVKYFINHSHALAIFRTHSKLELLKVAKTRFASHYVMLQRLVKVREALATTVVLNSWKEWMKNGDHITKEMGALIAEYIGSDDFWEEVQNLLAITKPIYKLIRFCDKDGPIMGEIYEGMDNMLGEIKDAMKDNIYGDHYPQIEGIVIDRWAKMNFSMHSLGFALSPRFYDTNYISTPAPGGMARKRPNEDKEVMSGILKAFDKIASDSTEARLLRKQYSDFQMRKGLFAAAGALLDAVTMDAIQWWGIYGSETPELAEVARKILCQPITTSSAERNWSTYSHIHNVKRNRLNSSRADKLVFIHSNIRLLARFQEDYREGPFKKWDVDPEDAMIDDSHVRLEEMRWPSLDDENFDIGEETIGEEDMLQAQQSNARVGSSTKGKTQRSTPTFDASNSQPRRRIQQSNISNFMRSGASSSKHN